MTCGARWTSVATAPAPPAATTAVRARRIRGTGAESTVRPAMVVVFSLGAAVLYALASVLQQRAASAVPAEHSMRLSLLTSLLARPLWLAGVTADLGGFLLEAAALGIGSLALVQPLMTLGLPVALAGAAYVSDQHMGRREWAATVVLTVGLAVFLGLATPSHGRDFARVPRWIPAAVVRVVLVAVCLVAAPLRALAEWQAPLLAVATGFVFPLSAALTKSVATSARRDLLGTLRHWELYALIAVGLISMLLGQSAFHGGHLRHSLPALTIVPPLVGTWMGWVLFHERIHATALTLPFE